MKKYIPLLLIILNSCSLLINYPIYKYNVNSYSTQTDFEKQYFIMPYKLVYEDEMLRREVENKIVDQLSKKGYKRVSEFSSDILTIIYNYDGEYRTVEVEKRSPVYGIVGSSTNSNGIETYNWRNTKYNETSTTRYNRGVVGYDHYVGKENYMAKQFHIAGVYMFDKDSISDMLWKTSIYSSDKEWDFRLMLSQVVENVMPGYIDTDTGKEIEVKVEKLPYKIKVSEVK